MGDSIDLFKSAAAEIDIRLRTKPFIQYAAVTTLVYALFTVLFYKGIHVVTLVESTETSNASATLVETYNTYSGYVMALVEVVVAGYVDKFMPVINVYVYNTLFHLQQDPVSHQLRPKALRHLRAALLFVFPIVLSLTMGSSIRSLQAVQINAGPTRVMVQDDMMKDHSSADTKAAPEPTHIFQMKQDERLISGNILKNAIRQQTTPFAFDLASPCGKDILHESDSLNKAKVSKSSWSLDPREAASSSVVYGFTPREWNREALTSELTKGSSYKITYKQAIDGQETTDSSMEDETNTVEEPTDFSLNTAYEMFVQAKMVIERAYGYSETNTYSCWKSEYDEGTPTELNTRSRSLGTDRIPSDNTAARGLKVSESDRQCEGGVSSLFMMDRFFRRDTLTAKDFVIDAADSIRRTIPDLALDETEVTLGKLNLTPQIELETMQIDLIRDPRDESFADIQTSFCGSEGCAFLERKQPYTVQPEIGVLPYVINCTLQRDEIHYNAEFRGFYPDNCSTVSDAAFLYGYGSYMTGEEYGSSNPWGRGAYMTAARRHIRFTFAKVTWKTEDLATTFNASCGETSDQKLNCSGLWYKLQSSGRYLFAGEHSLATRQLMNSDFRSSIPLVQLNTPQVYVTWIGLVSLERLVPANFKSMRWEGQRAYNGSALGGDQCSLVVDSYLRHINENNYFIEQPMEAMYTSFFYFIMQDAAVTQLNDMSASAATTDHWFNDTLGNAKLSGDIQIRSIRVAIPRDSFFMTLAGCLGIFVATFVIIFVPAPRVEYFCEEESKAEQFISMGRNADYPDDVHDKLLGFSSSKSIRFNAVRVESLMLVLKSPYTKGSTGTPGSTRYSRVSQVEAHDIHEDPSEGTSSEEDTHIQVTEEH